MFSFAIRSLASVLEVLVTTAVGAPVTLTTKNAFDKIIRSVDDQQ
jgi:hypothetical protein